jgi:predicted flap endonuclease-1-like 5' DNA nuclease
MTALAEIEGIGAVYQEKLQGAGVGSVEALLEQGATRDGRQKLAAASGVSDTLVLEWVNHADLFRVKGVGSEYADLLEEAGVDSVPELAQRNPANLAAALNEANESKRLVRSLPSESQVQAWVAEAKALPPVVLH